MGNTVNSIESTDEALDNRELGADERFVEVVSAHKVISAHAGELVIDELKGLSDSFLRQYRGLGLQMSMSKALRDELQVRADQGDRKAIRLLCNIPLLPIERGEI